MSSILLLILVIVSPIIALGFFIYYKDNNKEPIGLLVKLFLSGMGSCILVLIFSGILGVFFPVILTSEYDKLSFIQLIVHAFIGVAIIEELCKWIMVYKIAFHNRELDELYDVIVYSTVVALGFAFFENIFYVFQYGLGTGIVRALTAVPGHACFGVFMGYYLGLAKINVINNRNDLEIRNLLFSILIPTLFHGIYDYCLFTGNILLIFIVFVFVIFLYSRTLEKIRRVSTIQKKIKYKDNFCPICGHVVDGAFCPICGRKNE